MVWPILISLSLAPGSYFFSAAAGRSTANDSSSTDAKSHCRASVIGSSRFARSHRAPLAPSGARPRMVAVAFDQLDQEVDEERPLRRRERRQDAGIRRADLRQQPGIRRLASCRRVKLAGAPVAAVDPAPDQPLLFQPLGNQAGIG